MPRAKQEAAASYQQCPARNREAPLPPRLRLCLVVALWRPRYHRAVRRLVKLAVIALGIRALWSWRKRRRAAATGATPAPTSADPAEELRRKLAAARDYEAAEETVPTPETTVEERRTEVHEQARTTLDDMNPPDDES